MVDSRKRSERRESKPLYRKRKSLEACGEAEEGEGKKNRMKIRNSNIL